MLTNLDWKIYFQNEMFHFKLERIQGLMTGEKVDSQDQELEEKNLIILKNSHSYFSKYFI